MRHQMYGYFPGGDPRTFEPDMEVCLPREIAAWGAACAAWNRGERPEPAMVPHWEQTATAVVHLSGSSYGMGIYTWECDGDPECPECGTARQRPSREGEGR